MGGCFNMLALRAKLKSRIQRFRDSRSRRRRSGDADSPDVSATSGPKTLSRPLSTPAEKDAKTTNSSHGIESTSGGTSPTEMTSYKQGPSMISSGHSSSHVQSGAVVGTDLKGKRLDTDVATVGSEPENIDDISGIFVDAWKPQPEALSPEDTEPWPAKGDSPPDDAALYREDDDVLR